MRPFAIEIGFDAASDARLRRVWSDLATLAGAPREGELATAPHVTLALLRGAAPQRDVGAALDALARRVAPFALELDAVDRFPTREGVVYARPRPSEELMRAFTILHGLLGDDRERLDAYYRAGAWQPHCTLALGVGEAIAPWVMAAATAALGRVDVTRVQLVRYRPATRLAERPLDGRALVIRRACEADLAGICEAHTRAIRATCAASYAPAEIDAWAGRLHPGIHREAIAAHEFFVAVDGARVLGFGQLDAATGEIVGCYVHPDAGRRGVASGLLAALETRARDLGLVRLQLDASLNAVAFYRSVGFAGARERRHTLSGGVEIACVPMTKTLCS